MHFSDKLAAAIKIKNSCLMLGLDPNWEKLPAHLKQKNDCEMTQSVVFQKFCELMIDACEDNICGVKIQMAYFEVLGAAGIMAVQNLITYAANKGLVVLIDAKRGDIGSTCAAYAKAYLGNGPLGADSVTVNPFLGADGLDPFYAYGPEKGAFVLVKTSNPSGSQYQASIYEQIAKDVESAGKRSENGWSHLGAVVGATNGEAIAQARSLMPSTWILAPGVGTQGGKIEDVLAIRDEDGLGVLIPVSRSVLYASSDENYLKAAQSEIENLWESQKI